MRERASLDQPRRLEPVLHRGDFAELWAILASLLYKHERCQNYLAAFLENSKVVNRPFD